MSGRYCVDANIFIAAWYTNYPPRILKSLWKYIAECRDDIVLIKPVFDEIEPISSADTKLQSDKKNEKYPLRMWLEETKFTVEDVGDEVNNISIGLEREYQVSLESKGAGQVDITLIAYAKIMNKIVVTFESLQPNRPSKKSNYKIPLICQEQGVRCINFIAMLEELDANI